LSIIQLNNPSELAGDLWVVAAITSGVPGESADAFQGDPEICQNLLVPGIAHLSCIMDIFWSLR